MNIYCFSTLSFAKLQFKSVINKAFHKHGVASFTDAWIETFTALTTSRVMSSRIFYRCVDWNRKFSGITNLHDCHIFYRCVDWNVTWCEVLSQTFRRIFYRCVDWNSDRLQSEWNEPLSHLLQMRGLKLINPEARKKALESHLLQMRGLKLVNMPKKINTQYVASFTDAWIETSISTRTG